MKKGDKVITLINGFTGEVRCCQVTEDPLEDIVEVFHGTGLFGTMVARISDCKPAPDSMEIGTLVEQRRPIPIAEVYSEGRRR